MNKLKISRAWNRRQRSSLHNIHSVPPLTLALFPYAQRQAGRAQNIFETFLFLFFVFFKNPRWKFLIHYNRYFLGPSLRYFSLFCNLTHHCDSTADKTISVTSISETKNLSIHSDMKIGENNTGNVFKKRDMQKRKKTINSL